MFVLLACVLPRLRHPIPATYPDDFRVYYSAAKLVLQGDAADIYTGADRGTDPQKLIATQDTPIYRVAIRAGLPFVGLYVYPPILADLLVPIAALPLPQATALWYALNLLFLILTAVLGCRLLDVRLLSLPAAALLLAVLCFVPVLQCLVDGQITIFLLLLWMAGTLLVQRGHLRAAAIVFALATAIKLTPGLVLVPFLLWRQWRFVTSFAVSLLAMAVLCLALDGTHASWTFVAHVMPAMSGAIPYYTNYSIAAAVQRVLEALRAGTIAPFPSSLPPGIVLSGRVASLCVLAALIFVLMRRRTPRDPKHLALTIGLLGLLAPVISPVSWFHAYATAFVAFALLWADALRRPVRDGYLLTLTTVSLLLGSAVAENLLAWFAYSGHAPRLGTALQLGQLLLAAGLVLYRIALPESNAPPLQSTGIAA